MNAPRAAESTDSLDMLTPEGVIIPFKRAGLFDRLAALAIDQLIILVATALVLLVFLLVLGPAFGLHAISLFILANFLLRNAYFSLLEVRGGGATPGKRLLHLRVVSRDGGPLEPEQVMVRNLTREFEVFLPLVVMSAPQGLFPDLPPWAGVLCSLWLLAGALLPFVNRERLRLGDLLGGTTVVAMPRAELLEDLAVATPTRAAAPGGSGGYTFTTAQLDQYGIEQLHVLEELLRNAGGPGHEEVIEAVTRRVEAKIGWETPVAPEQRRDFLSAFYRELRGHLERKALFGVRQQRKREGRLRPGGPGPGPGAPGTGPR